MSNIEEVNSIPSEGEYLVWYSAPWCGPCRAVAPVLKEINEEGHIKVLKIDIDNNPDIANEQRILSIPNVVHYIDGEEKTRIVGANSKKSYMSKIILRDEKIL